MILVADSGSSKCDWAFFDDNNNQVKIEETIGLNPYLTSFVMEGNILSSVDDADDQNNLGRASHDLVQGWNLVSPKLVRPVDKSMLTVTDNLNTYTWDEAHELGIVSGELVGVNQFGYGEVPVFVPWTGYFIHSSKSCILNVAPHAFDLAMDSEEDAEYFSWNLNLQAVSEDGKSIGDIVKASS